jgi:hypothetical protein
LYSLGRDLSCRALSRTRARTNNMRTTKDGITGVCESFFLFQTKRYEFEHSIRVEPHSRGWCSLGGALSPSLGLTSEGACPHLLPATCAASHLQKQPSSSLAPVRIRMSTATFQLFLVYESQLGTSTPYLWSKRNLRGWYIHYPEISTPSTQPTYYIVINTTSITTPATYNPLPARVSTSR